MEIRNLRPMPTPGETIKAARKKAGLTQAALGSRVGVTQSVVSDWESGELSSWRDYADKLSRALSLDPRALATMQPLSLTENDTVHVSVVGEVQGGAFRMALEYPREEQYPVPVTSLPGYDGITLRALKVVGPSVNQCYPDGTYVIVASSADTDVRPGDKVVVYRSQGTLREATIKEIQVDDSGRIVLLPRSDHPDYQEPIYINPDDPDDQDRPEIAFVVVGSFRREERPPPPIQLRRKRP